MPQCQAVNWLVRIALCSEVIAKTTDPSADLLKHSSRAGAWELHVWEALWPILSAARMQTRPLVQPLLFSVANTKAPNVGRTCQIHIVKGQGRAGLKHPVHVIFIYFYLC